MVQQASTVQQEIAALEERLRQAELGPDARFFEEVLADELIIVADGQAMMAKSKVVEAHRPERGQKFTRVEMRDMKIVDHGTAAVVTCEGTFSTADASNTLKFMRVWVKTRDRWQIVAGTVTT